MRPNYVRLQEIRPINHLKSFYLVWCVLKQGKILCHRHNKKIVNFTSWSLHLIRDSLFCDPLLEKMKFDVRNNEVSFTVVQAAHRYKFQSQKRFDSWTTSRYVGNNSQMIDNISNFFNRIFSVHWPSVQVATKGKLSTFHQNNFRKYLMMCYSTMHFDNLWKLFLKLSCLMFMMIVHERELKSEQTLKIHKVLEYATLTSVKKILKEWKILFLQNIYTSVSS